MSVVFGGHVLTSLYHRSEDPEFTTWPVADVHVRDVLRYLETEREKNVEDVTKHSYSDVVPIDIYWEDEGWRTFNTPVITRRNVTTIQRGSTLGITNGNIRIFLKITIALQQDSFISVHYLSDLTIAAFRADLNDDEIIQSANYTVETWPRSPFASIVIDAQKKEATLVFRNQDFMQFLLVPEVAVPADVIASVKTILKKEASILLQDLFWFSPDWAMEDGRVIEVDD